MNRLWSDWAPLPLRLILGFGMVYHGWDKVADGTEGFQGMLQMMGIPGGAATAWFVALLEFVGGIALTARGERAVSHTATVGSAYR